jgi:hypothetical protein
MSTDKVSTVKRGDSRFYVHPETGAKAPGVTSVVNMLPKPFLQYWSAKLVAETAAENAGTLVQMLLTGNGDKAAAIEWLKGAPRRMTSGAADTGTKVHELCERIARGEDIGRVHPDLSPYVEHFREFVRIFEPEFLFMEESIWSETNDYAGTFDAIARIRGETIVLDWKTTRSGVHEEVALQMSAYANADYIVRADGGKMPLPHIDGAAVLHLRPEGWGLYPVAIGHEVFTQFLHLRATLDWDRDLRKKVLGKPIKD